jgi:hypothetical protein
MPRTRRRPAKPWTAADVKLMRTLAGKASAPVIAKRLKRTAGAVRQKALTLRLSLRMRKPPKR